MARDTFLGFPSHALPYRYRNSYPFIDRLRFLSLFRITAKEHIRPEFIGVAVLGVPLVVILLFPALSPGLGRPAHRLAAGRASGRTYAPKGS